MPKKKDNNSAFELMKEMAKNGEALPIEEIRDIRNTEFLVFGLSPAQFDFIIKYAVLCFSVLFLLQSFSTLTDYALPLSFVFYGVLLWLVFSIFLIVFLGRMYGKKNIFMMMSEYSVFQLLNPKFRKNIEKSNIDVSPYSRYEES
jgi:hypothetical protein